MDAEGPFRHASTVTCPTCGTPLLSAEPGEARRCPQGCGDWCAAAMVEARWGDCVDIDGDPRLRWRHSAEPMPCLVCGQPMRRVINSAWTAHRCRAHGVWFVKDSRKYFERVHADDIKAHLDNVRTLAAMIDFVHKAVADDPDAVRALAIRLLDTERALARLRAELADLREWASSRFR